MRRSPEIPSCSGLDKNAEHVFFTCPRFEAQCAELVVVTGNTIIPETLVPLMFVSETTWEKV
ncbi:hypothetical protein J6590_016649 [Homalodisca vitripennis]|nr:hypothetical protein J6590_016649 [Homalodisca vitripennis]